ncbi:hypothetical protein F4054_01865 [Candidatus Poribacteria bacterium]|nr:hypothetical protein [Candidatus Poribacteria bacterium]MYK20988.1 hypothetical protein [Candidatus Poribacteria bacterium]
MLHDLLSSRLIQAGLVFFMLCVGGSLLHSWHVHRTTDADLAKRPQPVVSPLKNKSSTSTAPVDFQNEGVTNTPDENTDASMFDETEAFPNETEFADIANAFLPDDFVSEEEAPDEDVPVSLYGFGPYPEIPADYPGTKPAWEIDLDALGYSESQKRDAELLSRVLIKLWTDKGIGSRLGGSLDATTKIVYPYYDNTIYVKREILRNEEGKPTGFSARIHAPGNMIITAEDLEIFRLTGETPPGVRVLQFDKDGIDAYQFLNVQP